MGLSERTPEHEAALDALEKMVLAGSRRKPFIWPLPEDPKEWDPAVSVLVAAGRMFIEPPKPLLSDEQVSEVIMLAKTYASTTHYDCGGEPAMRAAHVALHNYLTSLTQPARDPEES